MMAPQFLPNSFTIRPIDVGSAWGGRRAPRHEVGGLSSIGEELDVSRELISFKFHALGVWKGSRVRVPLVMSAQLSFRTRRFAGARPRVARCAVIPGRTR